MLSVIKFDCGNWPHAPSTKTQISLISRTLSPFSFDKIWVERVSSIFIHFCFIYVLAPRGPIRKMNSSFLSLISLFIILFGCPSIEADDQDELILVQALWRHGDRSPTRTFKTDIYQEDDWPQGWGQLTKEGMAQHVRLGKKLRERYMDEYNFVSKRYKSHEIYVRSTDFNRTLISAISNLIGFYGPGMDEDYPKELGSDWPGWYVPLPVHSIPGTEDFIVTDWPNCPRRHALHELVRQTPEFKKVVADYKWMFDFLKEKTDQEWDPFDIWIFQDAFFIEKIHKPKLVDWAEGNATILEAINKYTDYTRKWMDGIELSPVEGFDLSVEIPRILGGPILWKMIGNMQEKLQCEQRMNAVLEEHREIEGKKSPLGAPLCQWMNPMRYFVFSAHDSTIAALFSTFGFPKSNYDRDGLPPYSACVTVELWRRKSAGHEHFVKIHYFRPDERGKVDSVEITKDIVGCQQNECTLEQFVERSKPYQMLPSPAEYCKKPLKPTPAPAPEPTTAAPQNGVASMLAICHPLIMLISPLMALVLLMAP